MKFRRIVLQVNTHLLTESDFRFDITLSRWRQLHQFLSVHYCHCFDETDLTKMFCFSLLPICAIAVPGGNVVGVRRSQWAPGHSGAARPRRHANNGRARQALYCHIRFSVLQLLSRQNSRYVYILLLNALREYGTYKRYMPRQFCLSVCPSHRRPAVTLEWSHINYRNTQNLLLKPAAAQKQLKEHTKHTITEVPRDSTAVTVEKCATCRSAPQYLSMVVDRHRIRSLYSASESTWQT